MCHSVSGQSIKIKNPLEDHLVKQNNDFIQGLTSNVMSVGILLEQPPKSRVYGSAPVLDQTTVSEVIWHQYLSVCQLFSKCYKDGMTACFFVGSLQSPPPPTGGGWLDGTASSWSVTTHLRHMQSLTARKTGGDRIPGIKWGRKINLFCGGGSFGEFV